jgi:hypothetical protein
MKLQLTLIATSLCAVGCASSPTAPSSSSAASRAPYQAPIVPKAIEASPQERALFQHFARGVQIYRCAAAANSATPGWSFVAPEAELFANSAQSAALGNHGAGPFWQLKDGSKVNGSVKSRTDAPKAGAIPWLLLSTTSTGGPGTMAQVTSIQRIDTEAGIAPSSGCSTASDIGKEARVPYTAVYVYFGKV